MARRLVEALLQQIKTCAKYYCWSDEECSICQVWLVNVPTIESRSRHAWPADVGWAYAGLVKGWRDGSVREYRGVEVRERFLVIEECKGSTVTVDHRKTVVSAGVEKSNIVSRLTFATFYFTYYLRSNKYI